MSIDGFIGNWTIKASKSDILDDDGVLTITATNATTASIQLRNPGKQQESLGDASLEDDRLVISPLSISGTNYHFEAVRAESPRTSLKILYGILFRLSGGLPGADDGATGVWGADEEAPLPDDQA